MEHETWAVWPWKAKISANHSLLNFLWSHRKGRTHKYWGNQSWGNTVWKCMHCRVRTPDIHVVMVKYHNIKKKKNLSHKVILELVFWWSKQFFPTPGRVLQAWEKAGGVRVTGAHPLWSCARQPHCCQQEGTGRDRDEGKRAHSQKSHPITPLLFPPITCWQ